VRLEGLLSSQAQPLAYKFNRGIDKRSRKRHNQSIPFANRSNRPSGIQAPSPRTAHASTAALKTYAI
jgi:hypothetical protein